MKLADIEVGKTYSVKVPEHIDVPAFHARRYDNATIRGTVLAKGVHYDADHATTTNLKRRIRTHRSEPSERADGVTVALVIDYRTHKRPSGTVNIPCRNVMWEI